MTKYLCNVFTTSMLDASHTHVYTFMPISIEKAKSYLTGDFEQAVGHPGTCEVLSQRLGLEVKPVRANVRLEQEDILIVAQVVVPRLAEGEVLSKEKVDTLPIFFWLVSQ